MKNFSLIIVFFLVSCVTLDDLRKQEENQNKKIQVEQVKVSDQARNEYTLKIEELEREVDKLKGIIETQNHLFRQNVKKLKEQNKMVSTPFENSSDQNQTAEKLWEEIKYFYYGKKYNLLSKKLLQFQTSYANHEKFLATILLSGYISYSKSDFEKSVNLFNSILDLKGQEFLGAAAWFGAGASLSRLDKKPDAKLFFLKTVKDFPNTVFAKDADSILKQQKMVPVDLLEAYQDEIVKNIIEK